MSSLGRVPRYCAWLLRCWEVRSQQPDQPVGWRFSLEDPHTGHRHGFASLEAVVAFLRADLALGCDEPAAAAADQPADAAGP